MNVRKMFSVQQFIFYLREQSIILVQALFNSF